MRELCLPCYNPSSGLMYPVILSPQEVNRAANDYPALVERAV